MIVIANVFPKLQNAKDLVKPLSRKRCFRTSFESQRVNACQTLVKFALERLYDIFWSFWGEMICKISPLLKFQILGVFFNTLTSGDKYLVWDYEKLQFSIQMQLSQKQNSFSQFFVPFTESSWHYKYFRKKMILISNVFPKLKTVKLWLDHSPRIGVSECPLAVNMLKGLKHLWTLHESTFIIFFVILMGNDLQNISLIEVWNLRGVSSHID